MLGLLVKNAQNRAATWDVNFRRNPFSEGVGRLFASALTGYSSYLTQIDNIVKRCFNTHSENFGLAIKKLFDKNPRENLELDVHNFFYENRCNQYKDTIREACSEARDNMASAIQMVSDEVLSCGERVNGNFSKAFSIDLPFLGCNANAAFDACSHFVTHITSDYVEALSAVTYWPVATALACAAIADTVLTYRGFKNSKKGEAIRFAVGTMIVSACAPTFFQAAKIYGSYRVAYGLMRIARDAAFLCRSRQSRDFQAVP